VQWKDKGGQLHIWAVQRQPRLLKLQRGGENARRGSNPHPASESQLMVPSIDHPLAAPASRAADALLNPTS
jgi:hypothetical protein